jgi:phosphate transport system substrate-binding protein
MRRLVDYCVTTGQSIADSMGYIPLPANVVAKVKTASAQIQ